MIHPVLTHLRCITRLIVISLLIIQLAAVERDELPLGHPDFYPSPDRPVGWRGDGNGAFPGATLIDRFGDGRFQVARVNNKEKAWAAQGGSINIAWKHALPGWTMSQPIIVGDRVIQTCEPRTILCLDLNSGKEIWRQELCPFRMLGLKGEEREAALYWESASWTLSAHRYNKLGNYTRLHGKAKDQWNAWKAHAQNIIKLLEIVEPHSPDLVAKAREGLAPGLKILEGEPSDEHKKALAKAFCAPGQTLEEAFIKKFGFQATSHWYSFVGWTWPTPVCDGTWLYVYMNQGQIAKVALKDGSIAWLRRLSDGAALNLKQPIPRSPILHQCILYMLANDGIHALEAESGKEIWKWARIGTGGSHGKYNKCTSATGLVMVQLPSGRSILAHGTGDFTGDPSYLDLFDAKTGEKLHQIQTKIGKVEPGPSLMSEGDLVIFGNSGAVIRVVEEGDKINTKILWSFRRNANDRNAMVLHDGHYYYGHARQYLTAFEAATGKMVHHRPQKDFELSNYRPGILVGDKLLGSFQPHSNHPGEKQGAKFRGAYRWHQHFTIVAKDGRGPVSNHVLHIMSDDDIDPLQVPMPQAAPFLGKVLTSKDLVSICCGLPPTFGWGGMYAQGDKLLIPSTKYLYCIAPALKGLAGDDPAVADRIAKVTDAAALKEYLESSSAFYRHAAAKRLVDIDATPLTEKLKNTVLTEPYDAIRNKAVQALGESGYALIRQQISKRYSRHSKDQYYATSLATLGDQLDPIILPMIAKGADKEQREKAMVAISVIGNGGPRLRDVLLTMARNEQDRSARDRAVMALARWQTDEKVTAFLTKVINNGHYKSEGIQRLAYTYLRRGKDATEQIDFLINVALRNPDNRLRSEVADLLLAMDPRPEGLFDQFSAAAKAGSDVHLDRLAQASAGDREALTVALKDALEGGKNLRVAARVCMQLDIHALGALDALTGQFATTKDTRNRDNLVRAIAESVRHSKNVAVQEKGSQFLVSQLASKELQKRALEGLKQLGAKAASVLDAIKAINAGDDKRFKKQIDETVAHIARETDKRRER